MNRPSNRLLAATALGLSGLLALTGCGEDVDATATDAAPTAVAVPAGAQPSTGPIAVTVSDTSCALSTQAAYAGTNVLEVANRSAQEAEVYVYDGTRVVTEREGIAGGATEEITFEADAGEYQIACKPGDLDLRTALSLRAGGPTTATTATAVQAVAAYRDYVEGRVDELVPLVQGFAAAVKAGDVARAKALYAPSRVPWEAIEPVAESFGDLDPRIDLREADLEAGQTWTGWHRLEKALFVSGSTAGLAPVADQLVADVEDLQRRVPTAELTVTSIGNGAKELLDEVATGKITGEEEAFSHTDLVDFDANVAGAKQAYEVLKPLVQAQDAALVTTLDARFAAVEAALAPYARGGGTYVSYDTVTAAQRQELARVVDGLAEPLSGLAAAASS